MSSYIDIQKGKFVEFIKNTENRWKQRFHKVKVWAEENPELALTVLTIFTGAAIKGVKTFAQSSKMRKMEDLRNYYIYDHSTGHYWKTRHKIDNDMMYQIKMRRKNGEELSDILMSMGELI